MWVGGGEALIAGTTEKVLAHLKDSFDTADELDGFEDLPWV